MPHPTVKVAGIISKPGVESARKLVPALIDWLNGRGIAVKQDAETATYSGREEILSRREVCQVAEIIIVLGGDGTLLSAARAAGGSSTPLFAVNLGSLGFLTAIPADQLYPELERALAGDYTVSSRRMLHAELWRNGKCIGTYESLNDISLSKTEIARMIDFDVHVDDHFMCRYKADGIVVATPTGSTAYSLSAGGAIVEPTVSALCITPVCPHSLTNRSVIVPDQCVIRLGLLSESKTSLTVDGQVGESVIRGDSVVCRCSPHTVNLIRRENVTFFDVLREKLNWGGR